VTYAASSCPSTSTMWIDLPLRHEGGTPIIGEAKVAKQPGADSAQHAKQGGYDTDSVLALV